MAAARNQTDATPGVTPPDATGHRPVLLHPLIRYLQPSPGKVVVEGTLGAGGVAAALLEAVLPGGTLVAIDRDPEAVAAGRARFAAAHPDSVHVEHADFADLAVVTGRLGITAVDAVTLDLGISSLQLDDFDRGFSFRGDGPLDMRMDPSVPAITAADIVNTWDEDDLTALLRVFGEEPFARSISSAIVRRRGVDRFASTADLRICVERAVPRSRWPRRIHPATRTFQALRIEVNHELDSLDRGLQAAISLLRPGGRLGVISFHSLEDTIVKNTLHVAAQNCSCPPQQPHCTCAHRASLSLPTRKAIKPDEAEVAANPRARSARLRVAEKVGGEG